MRWRRAAAVLAACLAAAGTQAAPLPSPLTLEAALKLADDAVHPSLLEAEALRDEAQAAQLQAEAFTGARATLSARARAVEPGPDASNKERDDHRLMLRVEKPLYDFGRSEAQTAAADAGLRAAELRHADARARRRIEVMTRYFEVLLADLESARDTEAMATAYVEFDRARMRQELGQYSPVRVLESESRYMEVRQRMYASEARARTTRARLALALSRPDELPAHLAPPKLQALKMAAPDLAGLLAEARNANPVLAAAREEAAAAQERVNAARASSRPRLTGEVERSEYSRTLGANDRWRIGVELEVPLYDGGRDTAAIAQALAAHKRAQARWQAAQLEVAEQVREAWERLRVVQAQRDTAKTLGDYRDQYLDRSRALYELEVKADLGDAMVQTSEARLQAARADFDMALAWARLDALLGKPVYDGSAPPASAAVKPPPKAPAPVPATSPPAKATP
jgi:outer membrane protein TolC